MNVMLIILIAAVYIHRMRILSEMEFEDDIKGKYVLMEKKYWLRLEGNSPVTCVEMQPPSKLIASKVVKESAWNSSDDVITEKEDDDGSATGRSGGALETTYSFRVSSLEDFGSNSMSPRG